VCAGFMGFWGIPCGSCEHVLMKDTGCTMIRYFLLYFSKSLTLIVSFFLGVNFFLLSFFYICCLHLRMP
jgi:hypothetical protein